MAGHRRVVSAILFSPRGGSSHATRALSAGLPAEGWAASLVAGSRGDAGPEQDAHAFYAGQENLTVVDFTAALRAPDPMDPGPGVAPMHPSYEDRPGAPDRVFAALDDADPGVRQRAQQAVARRDRNDRIVAAPQNERGLADGAIAGDQSRPALGHDLRSRLQ